MALFTDHLQHDPPSWFTGWRGVVARLDLMTGSEPATPGKFPPAFMDRKATQSARNVVLDWPARKVVLARGAPVQSGAIGFPTRAIAGLKNRLGCDLNRVQQALRRSARAVKRDLARRAFYQVDGKMLDHRTTGIAHRLGGQIDV